MNLLHRGLAVVVLFVAQHAWADGPLPPPRKIVVCSSSGEVCAESDPRAERTVVFRKSGRKSLWSIKGWHRSLFVSNDGQSLVTAHDGLGLVPVDSDLGLEVLQFHVQGKLVRSVKLGDLYTDRSQLTRTVSHLAWVRSILVNRADQVTLELETGRIVAFAMDSGQAQKLAE